MKKTQIFDNLAFFDEKTPKKRPPWPPLIPESESSRGKFSLETLPLKQKCYPRKKSNIS